MMNLKLNKNKQLLKLEEEDQLCIDVLTNRLSVIRLDVMDEQKHDLHQLCRAEISLGENDSLPITMEIKDYRTNVRYKKELPDDIRISGVQAFALLMAWELDDSIEGTHISVHEESSEDLLRTRL